MLLLERMRRSPFVRRPMGNWFVFLKFTNADFYKLRTVIFSSTDRRSQARIVNSDNYKHIASLPICSPY